MKVCGTHGGANRYGERTGHGRDALTLSDVLRAAEHESTAHASEIVRGLLASGRIRFVNPDIQHELDVLSKQLFGAA